MAQTRWDGECLVYTGNLHRLGYGRIWRNKDEGGGQVYVHRYVLERSVPRPDGMEVCHSCDNRACLNLEHLTWGTHAQNMQERHQRGSWVQCLVPDQVRAIRSDLRSQSTIAADYGVSRSTINDIKNGYTWAHLD